MVFTPTAHQASVGTVILTQLSMEEVDQTGSVLSDFGALSTVTVTEAATPPTFTGSAPVEGTDQAPFAPAPGLTLVEPDFDATVSATLTLEAGTGTLSGSGLTIDSGGTYSIGATSVGELTGLLQGLTFDPTPGLVPVGDASTAQLLVTATEAGSGLTASALQTLTIDAVAAAPAITGLAGPIGGDSSTPYQVFPQIDITSTEYQPAEYAVLVLQAPEGTGSTGSDRSAEDALSGSGLLAVAGQPGAYTYVLDEASPVTPAALAAALQDIVFDPAPGLAPFGTAVQTTLDLTVFDSAGVTSTATQDLVTTYVPATPVIADFQTTASITDQQTLDPAFGTVSISLADYEPQVSATIDINALVGSLAGTGLVAQGRGDYVLAATTPADLAGELDSLVYTPIPGRTAVNQQTTTDLTLTIGYPQASGIAGHSVQGSIQAQETLTITAAPAIPVISGAADVSIEKGVTADPFAGVTIVDPTQGAIETLQISFNRGGVGVLTAPGLTSPTAGVYRLTGTVAQVNADLAAADYVDDAFPGSAGTLQVTLSDSSSVGSTVVDSADVSFDIEQPAAVACFCRGTRISTERGEVAVEELAVGDRVVTAEGNLRPIRWLGHRRIDCTRHPDPAGVWPVLVRRSAFADGAPARDLWLSPCHSIAAEGALVPIRILLNGGTVRQVERPRVEYWYVELDTHDVILAEGLPAESYLDTGNRGGFTNGAVVAQGPPQHPKHWAETCLPLAFAGPLVDQIRAALLARAISLGFDITDDAGLHAVADGVRIEPVWLAADRFALMLPPGAGDISLRSRQFVPCQVEPASRDERTLGVCVGRLQIDGATVDLVDEAVCGVGWHALERYEGHVQRWTTGVAKLPARTRLAVIDLAGTGSYWADLRLSGHVLCG